VTSTQPGIALAASAVRSALLIELDSAGHVVPVTTAGESAPLSRDLVDALIEHRVLPLVTPAAEQLGFDAGTVHVLQGLHREQQLAAMPTLAMTVRVSVALAAADVPCQLLKGAALAVQTTGDPLGRGPGDVDVLLPARSVAAALAALGDAGLEVTPVGTPDPDAATFPATVRSQKELTLLGQGLEIDLHWRLDDARDCLRWPFEELLAAAETVSLGGVEVRTLSQSHGAVYHASHAGSDAWSHLRAFVDQARLQRGQDLSALREEAYRVGAGRRWDLAQAMLARLLQTPSPTVSRSIDALANAMWRWLLAGEGPRDRTNARASARGLGASLLSLDSPPAGLQRLEAVVWPVGAMAERTLGDVGDRHPWFYPLATPYFLPKRLVEQWRAG
jgi:hypothetical protein